MSERLTPTVMQDLVARALVKSGNVIPSDRFPRFCEELRLALPTQPTCRTCRFFDFTQRDIDLDGKGCCENGRVLSLFMCLGPYDFNVPPDFGCNYHEPKVEP